MVKITKYSTKTLILIKSITQKVHWWTWAALGIILIFSPIVYFTLINPGAAAAEWFDESWAYRKKIPITNNTTAETNVYVAFDGADVLDTSASGKFQGDCGDIRFTNQSGELLPYIINSGCTTSSTDIDVFFDTLPAGTINIYMYYANPAVADGFVATAFSTEASNYTIGTLGSEVAGPGPAGYWAFDEGVDNTCSGGTNDACDSTSSGNDGALTGATWQSEDLCLSGKCMFFDGTADNVSITDPSDGILDPTSALTIEALIRPISDGEGNFGRIISNVSSVDFYVQTDDNDTVSVCAQTGGTTDTCSSDIIPLSQWTHVAVVYTDANTRNFYINGKIDVTNDSTNNLANSSSAKIIGDDGAVARSFDGFIDEVKVYPYARSAAEIKADFLLGGGTVLGASINNLSDGLVGYWKMDESAVDTCTGGSNDSCDSSGNGNDGAWNAQATFTSGKFGNGTTYDGAGDYTNIGDVNYMDGVSQLTISSWVQASTLEDYMSVLGKGVSGQPNQRTGYSVGSATEGGNDDVLIYLANGNNEAAYTTGNIISTGSWDLWTMVFDGSKTGNTERLKFYLNGVEQALTYTATVPSTTSDTTHPFVLGAHNSIGNDSWNGQVDETRIYNRALSPSEVSQLYNFAPGPVGYWPMDENTGTTTVYDTSGNANNGTMNGSMTQDDWVPGKFGGGLNFDGSDDNISITNDSAIQWDQDQPFTINAWIYPQSTPADRGFILSKEGVVANTFAWALNIDSSNNFNFTIGKSSVATTSITCTETITLNRWYYLTGVYDGTNGHCYLNGANQTTTAPGFSAATDSTYNLGIGRRIYNSTLPFDGYIDEVKIYNYARNSQQIVEDMNAGHPTGGSPIGSQVAYWDFDELYGDSANDSVGSNNGNLGAGTTCPQSGDSACPTWTSSGKLNGALDFETSATTDDYVDTFDFDPVDFTFTAWVNKESTGQQTIIAECNSGSTDCNFYFRINEASGFYSGSFKQITIPDLSLSVWHHVALTYDGATLSYYLDGVLTVSGSASGTPSDTNLSAKIGRLGDFDGQYWDGQIDEMKIYNSALTQSQILIDMNFGGGTNFSASFDEAADLTDGAGNPPVAYWKMDENTGTTANDTSGNENTGTLTCFGPSCINPSWSPGKYGSATNFTLAASDASTYGYIDITNQANFNFSSDFTVSLWLNASVNSGNFFRGVIGKYEGTATAWDLGIGSDGKARMVLRGSSNIDNSGVGSDLRDGKWHHLEIVNTPTSITTYIDGIFINTTSGTWTSATNTQNVYIGNRGTNTVGFLGLIDQVQIYDYARTQAQISYDFNRGAPVGWWDFDECQGTTLNDISGKGNNGTWTGGGGTNTTAGTCGSGISTEAWNNGTTGKRNASLDFDRTDDQITVTDPADEILDFGTNDFSISTWINPEDASNFHRFILKGNPFNLGGTGYSILYRGDVAGDPLHVQLNDSADGCLTNASSGLGDISNKWTHIVAVIDRTNTNVDFYVNGKFLNTVSISGCSGSFSNSSNLSIGGTSAFFGGQIDDMRIYNYALSGSQIRKIMLDGSHGGGARFGPDTGSP